MIVKSHYSINVVRQKIYSVFQNWCALRKLSRSRLSLFYTKNYTCCASCSILDIYTDAVEPLPAPNMPSRRVPIPWNNKLSESEPDYVMYMCLSTCISSCMYLTCWIKMKRNGIICYLPTNTSTEHRRWWRSGTTVSWCC